MKLGLWLAAVLGTIILAGCLESRQDFVLNPDGSGKVAVDLLIMDVTPMMGGEAGQGDPELPVKRVAREILDRTTGADTWTGIAFDRAEDGRIHFKGTAYFKDFAKMRLSRSKVTGVSFTKDDQGGMVLTMDTSEKKPPAAAPPSKLSEDEIAQRVKDQRDKAQATRPMLELVMAKFKMDLVFRLPGTVAEATHFQREPGGAVRLLVDGQKILQAMDRLMADDAFMRGLATSGESFGPTGSKMSDAINEELFGSKASARVRVNGDLKPLFDYEAESKKARDAYPKMIEQLGLDKLPPAPPRPQFRGMMTPPGGAGGAPPQP
jgi:hypothetical protein